MRPPTTRITVTGGSWPAQIWQLFVGGALAETAITPFPAPAPPSATDSTTTTAPADAGRTPLLSVTGMSVANAIRRAARRGLPGPARGGREPPVPARDPALPGPAGRRPARVGMTVTINVSNGPPRSATVPNVLGAFADEAATTLRAAGFEVEILVRPEPPPGNPARAGRVWKQSPITGAVADAGAPVTVSVNPT